jgi:sugar lactone lactonase YvrE
VAEYGAGQITVVSLADGSKSVLTSGLDGPLAMAAVGDMIYVAESKPGRISVVNSKTGHKEVFMSSMVGKPGAIANDGSGNLLILDGAGKKLIKVNPDTLEISVVAGHLPIAYATVGSYPSVEFPLPMSVSAGGDIYLNTMNRGLLKFKKLSK